jgi:ABC-type phosphate/phosphonate transport system ATPase subunit
MMTQPNVASLDLAGPFGNPDGSRADLDEVLDNFVDFRGNPVFGALATRANDATAQVIVGRMGAGKTVYLRRLHSYQQQQESVFAGHIQQSVPTTEVIVKACQWAMSCVRRSCARSPSAVMR